MCVCVCVPRCGYLHLCWNAFLCVFLSDTPSPTTHSVPRSHCMRRTARWQPGSSGCGKSLIRWGCGGQWRVSSLSMNTDCLMFYSCSWAQLSLNCECLMFRALLCEQNWGSFSCTGASQFASLLQAWWRVEPWGRWGGGSEAPDDRGSYQTLSLVSLCRLFWFCVH